MRNSFFTIDTDNAVIRLYHTAATSAGLTPAAIRQVQADLGVIARALSVETKSDFHVEVVL